MTQRQQRGWLKRETRIQGETWVLYFRTTRKFDGRRVENKIPIGLVRDFPDKSSAWAEFERLHLALNTVDSPRGVTFADLAQHYTEHELVDRSESIHPKAHTTIKGYERDLRNRLLPKWGSRIALGIQPLEIEQWLTTLKREEGLENPTLEPNASCHVDGLSPWPTIWLDFPKSRVEPDALRSLQDDQRIRSDDHNSRTSL